jgi:hypothetical protein
LGYHHNDYQRAGMGMVMWLNGFKFGVTSGGVEAEFFWDEM